MAIWVTILRQAPMLLSAADALLSRARRSARTPPGGDGQALGQRIEDIEAHQQANAEVVKQLTEQIAALGMAARASADRARLALMVALAALALSVAASLVIWLR